MKIIGVEGVGVHFAAKLKKKGVRTTERLLDVAGTSKGRKDLAKATGISEKLILEWVNHADLMRIHGVGEEYSDLLEEAGVDTVKELRNRVPRNLLDAILKVNKTKNLVRRTPSLSMVKRWVAEAKRLPPKVTY